MAALVHHLRLFSSLSAPKLGIGRLVLSNQLVWFNFVLWSSHPRAIVMSAQYREDQRPIQRSMTRLACSQFIYRQSSFLFWSGSSLGSSLSRCTMASVHLNICLSWHTEIQFLVHLSFIYLTPLEWLQHSWHSVLVSYWISPLCCSHCKDLLIQRKGKLSGSDCCRLIIEAL